MHGIFISVVDIILISGKFPGSDSFKNKMAYFFLFDVNLNSQ
jgi:hypothetical protein